MVKLHAHEVARVARDVGDQETGPLGGHRQPLQVHVRVSWRANHTLVRLLITSKWGTAAADTCLGRTSAARRHTERGRTSFLNEALDVSRRWQYPPIETAEAGAMAELLETAWVGRRPI